VWLLLAVGFTAVDVRYIYLTFYQEGPGELFLNKILGLADGIPLAVLCLSIFFLQRRTRLRGLAVQILVSVAIGLGLCFLVVGIFEIFDSWPEPEKSLHPGSLLLITLGFVGYPLGVLLVAYRYWSHRDTMAGSMATSLPFFVCIGLHILEFLVSWFWPFGLASLFGAASLAFFFAATNFSLLTRSTDLRP
jgi:uncharacterized membrane protein YphA (DoxX/SURF4 family)